MAKNRQDNDVRGLGPADPVRVLVHKAISIGGVAHRPVVDGKRVTPSEAVIPYERAVAHGDDVEILGPAEADGAKQSQAPADKQVTGGENK